MVDILDWCSVLSRVEWVEMGTNHCHTPVGYFHGSTAFRGNRCTLVISIYATIVW